MDSDRSETLAAHGRALEREEHFSGIFRATRGDEVLVEWCHGFANRADAVPVRPATRFATASLSKMFTAVGVPPICPPGTAYHYSNAGYVLLGVILAEVSGMTFADAVVSRVFAPAAMSSSGYPALDEVHTDIAQNYLPPQIAGGPWRTNIYAVPPVGGGDGGAVVTAEDVERFLRAVQRGGVWHLEPADVLTPRARSWEEWHVGYGVDLRPDGVWGQDGADPGVLVISRYRPSTDTTAVFLANVDEDAVEDLETLAYNVVNTALDT